MREAEFDAWMRNALDAVESALERWVPGDAPEVINGQPATLDPTLTGDIDIAGQDSAFEVRRRLRTEDEMGDPHPSRAAAASSARPTWTAATCVRYSRSAWMSEATVIPSVACADASPTDAPPSMASSTAVAR